MDIDKTYLRLMYKSFEYCFPVLRIIIFTSLTLLHIFTLLHS